VLRLRCRSINATLTTEESAIIKRMKGEPVKQRKSAREWLTVQQRTYYSEGIRNFFVEFYL
jgi:hypothetical protein